MTIMSYGQFRSHCQVLYFLHCQAVRLTIDPSPFLLLMTAFASLRSSFSAHFLPLFLQLTILQTPAKSKVVFLPMDPPVPSQLLYGRTSLLLRQGSEPQVRLHNLDLREKPLRFLAFDAGVYNHIVTYASYCQLATPNPTSRPRLRYTTKFTAVGY